MNKIWSHKEKEKIYTYHELYNDLFIVSIHDGERDRFEISLMDDSETVHQFWAYNTDDEKETVANLKLLAVRYITDKISAA